MNLSPLHDLAATWRDDADTLRRRGAQPQADTLEAVADELEERLEEWRLEALTLEQAASETGLAYDTVQRKVANNEWPNHGKPRAPRVRRCDLHPGLDSPAPLLHDDPVEDLAERTLRAREGVS